jgi:hypothetical protein
VEIFVSGESEESGVGALLGRLVCDEGVVRNVDLAAESREVGPLEDDEHVDGVGRRVDLLRGDAHGARGLAASNLRPVRLRLDDVEALPRGRLRQQVAERDHTVASRAHHRDRDVPSAHGDSLPPA